ncbi:MAG: hypothetical protein GEU78_00290 [Actinobacteria bacterium]|nr:hypothetical protein [Actinomycetota bacterium]
MNPYLAAFVSGMRRTVAPGELIVRVGFYAVILVVFAAVWNAAMAANGGEVAGYGFAGILWYIAAAEAAQVATNARMIEDIGNDIGNGTVAIELLRPVSVVGLRLASEVGGAVVRLAGTCALAALFVPLAAGPPPSWNGVGLAIPSLVLAVCCNLAAQHAFAGIAFWLEDAKSAWFLYQKLIFLLGGMLLPLELLPDAMSGAARLLPFWAMSYAPGRLMAGYVEPWLLLLQVGWLVAMVGAAVAVFSSGERRLQAVGG